MCPPLLPPSCSPPPRPPLPYLTPAPPPLPYPRSTVAWAKRRFQMGLMGFGVPWEGEGSWGSSEETWHMLRKSDLEEVGGAAGGRGRRGVCRSG